MRRISYDVRQKIRKMVKSGMSKYQASNDTGVCYITVCKLTKDLPSKQGNRELGRKSVEILQKMTKDGYFIGKHDDTVETSFRTLSKYFPVRRVNFRRRTIYFLENRNEDALKGFIEVFGRKVRSYQNLAQLASLFKVSLSAEMKQEMIGNSMDKRINDLKNRIFKKRALRGLNHQISDFIGNFLHSELLFFALFALT